jgi:hypothetical protein
MMEHHADLIEYESDRLRYHIEGWVFSGHEITEDIQKFIDWCFERNEHALHAPRTGDGKSFYQRREEAKNGQKNVL